MTIVLGLRRLTLLVLVVLATSGHSESFKVPALQGPVTDSADMLSSAMRRKLESYLVDLKGQTGTELVVATVSDLAGLSIEEAAIKITDSWKLGSAEKDNGVLLLIAREERKVRIEVGYGHEGNLPDVIASRIIREVIIPRFKAGQIDRGVNDGVLAITHYVAPEFLVGKSIAPKAPIHARARLNAKYVELGLMLIFFLIIIVPAIFGRGSRRRRGSALTGGLAGYGLGRSWGGGGFGGGSRGGSWGGGGGFGGGGASGGW